jgi:peptidoglycan-N-acetylglucosamine deacetylase
VSGRSGPASPNQRVRRVLVGVLHLLAGCGQAPTSLEAPVPTAEGAPMEAQVRVALTFDDLPYMTRKGGATREADPQVWAAVSTSILAALAAVGAPAAVFVNCGNLPEDDELVPQWRSAGHAIGNHTAHHKSAAHTDLTPWMADVRACDGLWEAESAEPRWFRFPYLWRGETVERRDAALGALAQAGYQPVPVTADSQDWIFEVMRDVDVAANPTVSAELGPRLVSHTAASLTEARQISREKLGREAPQILLFHVAQVTADHLPATLAALQDQGAVFVPLFEAMTDPLYTAPDAWAGPGSRGWLARTAPTERPDGTRWYGDRMDALEQELAERSRTP